MIQLNVFFEILHSCLLKANESKRQMKAKGIKASERHQGKGKESKIKSKKKESFFHKTRNNSLNSFRVCPARRIWAKNSLY